MKDLRRFGFHYKYNGRTFADMVLAPTLDEAKEIMAAKGQAEFVTELHLEPITDLDEYLRTHAEAAA